MGQWREIAAGADRAFFGNNRMYAAIEHLAQHFDDLETNSAEAEREHVGAEQHHRAHLRYRKRIADTTGVAAHQIKLKLAQLALRNANIGQFAETGVHSVNNLFAGDDFLDDFARRKNTRTHDRRNVNGLACDSDGRELTEGNLLALQFHSRSLTGNG